MTPIPTDTSPGPASRSARRPVVDLVVLSAAVALVAFAALRAVRVPLTYDEAASYLRYVAAGPLSIFDLQVATNHLLYTALARLFSWVGGSSEAVLRAPSLVGMAIYLLASWSIARRLSNPLLQVAGVVLLGANPYLLEYFALARGYGLSVGLMMASIACLYRYLDGQVDGSSTSPSPLWASLLSASAAVISNFSFLSVYAGLVVFVCAAAVVINARRHRRGATQTGRESPGVKGTRRRWAIAALAIGAGVFNVLVLSQDINLSPDLYEPITVTLTGPSAERLDQIQVSLLDARGRQQPLSRDGAAWRLGTPAHACGLVFDLPADTVEPVDRIDMLIGSRAFAYESTALARLVSHNMGDRRAVYSDPATSLATPVVPAFSCVINWKGNLTYVRVVVIRAGTVVALLGVLALLLAGVGRLVGRARLVTPAQWRPVAASVWLTSAFAGVPLFILRRNGELFYGGNRGVVDDTFLELLRSAFYGATYHPAQIEIAFASVALLYLTGIVALVCNSRHAQTTRALRTACVLTLLATMCAFAVAQRALFGTPYPLGRTALPFLPLAMLLFIVVCDGLAVLGRWPRRLSVSIACAAAALSLYHLGRTANLRSSYDWPDDADTRDMADDLRMAILAVHRPDSRLSLGVDWILYPVAEYYVSRGLAGRVDVSVASPHERYDLLYLKRQDTRSSLDVLRRYPGSRTVLARGGIGE